MALTGDMYMCDAADAARVTTQRCTRGADRDTTRVNPRITSCGGGPGYLSTPREKRIAGSQMTQSGWPHILVTVAVA